MCSKPRGRPRVLAPVGAPVTTWLRLGDYDRLVQVAKLEQKTVSAIIRELVKVKIG